MFPYWLSLDVLAEILSVTGVIASIIPFVLKLIQSRRTAAMLFRVGNIELRISQFDKESVDKVLATVESGQLDLTTHAPDLDVKPVDEN